MQSKQLLPTIRVKYFRIPKRGERENASCEDSCGFTQLGAHAAVADGVGQSHLPAMWARILIDSFCKNEGPLSESATREGWKAKAGQWYADEVRQRSINLKFGEKIPGRIRIPAPDEPSAATFCGVRFEEAPSGLVAEVLSKGDAFGFHIRAGKLLDSSAAPVASMGLGSAAIDTTSTFDWSSLENKRWQLQPGDRVVLATDKVAGKVFEICRDADSAGINGVLQMQNLEAFQTWTAKLIEDDHTLMILEVLTAPDKVADLEARRVIVSDREGYYTIVEGLLCPDRVQSAGPAAARPQPEKADPGVPPLAPSPSVPPAPDPLRIPLLISTCVLALLYLVGNHIQNGKLELIKTTVEANGSKTIGSQLTGLLEGQRRMENSFKQISARLTEDQSNQTRINMSLLELTNQLGKLTVGQATATNNFNEAIVKLRADVERWHTNTLDGPKEPAHVPEQGLQNAKQLLERQGEALKTLKEDVSSLFALQESQQTRVLLEGIRPQGVRQDAEQLLEAFKRAYPALTAKHLQDDGPFCESVAVVIFDQGSASDLTRQLAEAAELKPIRAKFRWFVVKASGESSVTVCAIPLADLFLGTRDFAPYRAGGDGRNSK